MQSVSELWNTLRAMPGTEVEYRFDIAGVTYGNDDEVSHDANRALYTEFGIGNATCAGLNLQIYAENIPQSAKIQRFCRLVNGDQVSEWLPAGVYYTSIRSEEDGLWNLEAFDDMRKAEKIWEPDQTLEFPMPMDEAVAEICRVLGFALDDRTDISHAYTIDYPQSEQTFRQTLKWIAAANGGNFIFTPAGKLRLVPLLSAPGDTSYLVDENNNPITFGGTRILVGNSAVGDSANPNGQKHYVGLDLFSIHDNGLRKPVSRITLLADDENAYTAGDDTGLELVADCPYATQAMVNALLAKLAGFEYQAFSAEGANLDPAAELGDGITAGGVYSVLASITEDGSGYPDISAPGDVEREEEYPEGNYSDQAFNRKLAVTRSLIAKNSESVQILVERTDGLGEQFASFDLALDEIALTVSGINRDMTALELRADGIEASVSSVQSGLSQTVRLAADGLTITNAAGSKLTIDGGQVNAENLNLTGRITFNDLSQNVKNRFGDGLTEDDIYTYIDESLVAAPTIAGAVFMDYDQEVALYLDKGRTDYNLVLEDESGELFNIWGGFAGETGGLMLRGLDLLSVNGGTFYAWGTWDFSNANVIGL